MIFPFLIFLGWLWFLHMTGHQPWNDWNFSNTAKQGSFYTVINNLLTFQFLNQYAYENWRHLFIFNFNWAFWLLALYGIWDIVKSKKLAKNRNAFSIIFLYTVGYTIGALSFQTYPITRYILPLLPFVYLFAAVGFVSILDDVKTEYLKYLAGVVIVFIIITQLFTSNDPISNILWRKTNFLGENVYVSTLGGPDAMTYNMEFLWAAKKRDQLIRKGYCSKDPDLEYRPQIFALLHIPLCPNEINGR